MAEGAGVEILTRKECGNEIGNRKIDRDQIFGRNGCGGVASGLDHFQIAWVDAYESSFGKINVIKKL